MRTVPIVLGALLACATALHSSASASPWDARVRGANLFDHVETRERLAAAAAQGIRVVRLAPDKWAAERRDFLIGDADRYDGLAVRDLAQLRAVLDAADSAGVRVVLTLLSLPGARWRQHNGDRSDFRLYRDPAALEQAERCWADLAAACSGHPALVGYDLLNEPHPSRAHPPAGLPLREVMRRLLAAVRSRDSTAWVIVEPDDFASPDALEHFEPFDDPRVLYSFHFYEPWAYIDHRQRGRFTYPGRVGEAGHGEWVDAAWMEACVAPVVRWQARHGVPSSRVLVGEFGVPRTHPGAERWLADAIRTFERHGWHWMFYSFREDTWHAMDYEAGTRPPGARYWAQVERGETPVLARGPNALWSVISRGLAGDTTAVASPVKRRAPRRP